MVSRWPCPNLTPVNRSAQIFLGNTLLMIKGFLKQLVATCDSAFTEWYDFDSKGMLLQIGLGDFYSWLCRSNPTRNSINQSRYMWLYQILTFLATIWFLWHTFLVAFLKRKDYNSRWHNIHFICHHFYI